MYKKLIDTLSEIPVSQKEGIIFIEIIQKPKPLPENFKNNSEQSVKHINEYFNILSMKGDFQEVELVCFTDRHTANGHYQPIAELVELLNVPNAIFFIEGLSNKLGVYQDMHPIGHKISSEIKIFGWEDQRVYCLAGEKIHEETQRLNELVTLELQGINPQDLNYKIKRYDYIEKSGSKLKLVLEERNKQLINSLENNTGSIKFAFAGELHYQEKTLQEYLSNKNHIVLQPKSYGPDTEADLFYLSLGYSPEATILMRQHETNIFNTSNNDGYELTIINDKNTTKRIELAYKKLKPPLPQDNNFALSKFKSIINTCDYSLLPEVLEKRGLNLVILSLKGMDKNNIIPKKESEQMEWIANNKLLNQVQLIYKEAAYQGVKDNGDLEDFLPLIHRKCRFIHLYFDYLYFSEKGKEAKAQKSLIKYYKKLLKQLMTGSAII